ncbi:MAG: tetratricopeptide repeat protein [Planctomycetota bacterium]
MKRLPGEEEVFKKFEMGLYEAALRSNPNNVEALRSLGYIYSREGLHDKALEIDQRLVRLLPEESIVHYNLACSYSQLNNLDGALNELEMSVLLGYSDWKHMDNDKDLDNLRKDPRYQQLMASLKKKYIV